MNSLIQCKTTIMPFLIASVLACFGLLPKAEAVVPAPDGGYPGGNTAEGQNALLSRTTGGFNTAVGWLSLRALTTGSYNTGVGAGTLVLNSGDENTATGAGALLLNTTGAQNTANGAFALFSNTTGIENVANGSQALYSNTTGSENTANGQAALVNNTTGADNTANGVTALRNNTTGDNNIAVGSIAGFNLTTGDNNIDIGNEGVAAEADTIRIGTVGTQTATFIAGIDGVAVAGTAVVVNASGQLGVAASSQRFKDEIKPMDKASEAILALKPVTFRYKQEIDPEGIPQFGLVAEDVEKVNPDLVARDAKGEVYTVRYEAVNAMLLNEFLKEHRKVEEQKSIIQEQQATISELKSAVARQQSGLEALAAHLREQDSKIQRVSAQFELGKPELRAVLNDQ